MMIEIVKEDLDMIEFKLVDGDSSVAITLVNELLSDPNVIAARYYLGHPAIDYPSIIMNVKNNAKISKIIKGATQRLSKRYGKILDSFELGQR